MYISDFVKKSHVQRGGYSMGRALPSKLIKWEESSCLLEGSRDIYFTIYREPKTGKLNGLKIDKISFAKKLKADKRVLYFETIFSFLDYVFETNWLREKSKTVSHEKFISSI